MPATLEALIRKTPNAMGGAACIRRTRIAVWTLAELKRLGLTDTQLLADYPGLSAEDLEAAWEYQRSHADEIDIAIRTNNEA